MATEDRRKQLISQIPTEQGRAGPAAQRLGFANTELGRNLSNTAMALPGAGSALRAVSALPAVSRLATAGVSGATTAGAAIKSAAPYAVPTAGLGTVAAASQSGNSATSQRLGATANPTGATAVPQPVAPTAAQTATASIPNSQSGQIAFDRLTNTYSGTNVGGNATIVNGRGGGGISVQNERVASALAADQQFNSVARLAKMGNVPSTPQRGMLAAPSVTHSGNDYSARKRLENLKTGASSIMNRPRWGGRNAHLNPSVVAYQQALQADFAAQGKQADMEMQTIGLNAGLMREQMGQEGANQRAAMGERTAAQRLGMDARRLQMDEATQGLQTRQAQRIESAQNDYLNATDDSARELAVKRLSALSGKDSSENLRNNFMETGGGQEWVKEAGAMRSVPKSLIDLRTGREVRVGGDDQLQEAPKAAGERVIDRVYRAPNGQNVRWTKDGWVDAGK